MSKTNLQLIISAKDEYSKQLQNAEKKAKELDKAIGSSTVATDKVAEGMAKVGKSIPLDKTAAWRKSLVEASTDAITALAPLTATLESIGKAIDFETSLADVGKVADFADTASLEAFGKELQKLSREIPLTVTELAAMAEAGGQMGIAKDQLTGFVEVAAKMATAFKMTGDESGQAIGTLMTVFNLSIPQVEKLGDAINVLGNTTNAKEKEIIDVLTRIGGIGQQFGLSAKELSALAASFLSLGKSPEVAGTAINALLSKLSTANVQSKDFKEALGALGLSANQLADDISTNPTQALDAFLTKLQSLPKQIQGDTIGRLFGAEFADDIAALVQSLDTYRKNLAGVVDENSTAGAMQDEFAKRLKTTQAELDLMKNALNEIAVNLGSTFLPAVRALAQGIAEVSKAIATLVDNPIVGGALIAGMVALAAKTQTAKLIIEALLGTLSKTGVGVGVLTTIGKAADDVADKVGGVKKAIELLSKLSFGSLIVGTASLSAGYSAGAALAELAYNKITEGAQKSQQAISELVYAQRAWSQLQTQAQTAGMSDAQLEQIRQLKIETLNTQAVLQQGAQFNAQLNDQAMTQVRAQVQERMRLQDLLAAKVVEKANAEAALEKAKQAEIKQARIDSYNLAKQKLDQFINDKRTALQNEQQAEKTAIDNIKQLRQQLADQLQSDADRTREIQRRDMDEGAQQADIAAQAAEKLAAAQQAAYNGDGKGASKLANDAKALAERLKDSAQAMELFKQASDLDKQANELQQYQEQLKANAAREQQVKIGADISAAESQLELLNANIAAMTDDPKQVQIEAVDEATAAINAIQAQLDALKDKTVTVTVVEKTVQARRWGGFITDPLGNIPKFRTGGKLPGYGGGDRVHALLEAGEYIIRKEAVAKYGAGALHAINNMRLPKFQNGGMVGAESARTGSTTPDLVNINLNLGGGRIVPFTTKREQVQSIKDAFAFIERGGLT